VVPFYDCAARRIGEMEVIDRPITGQLNTFLRNETYDERTGGGSMISKKRAMVVMALVVGLIAGCSTGSVTKEERDTLFKQAQASRQEWNKVDPQVEAFAKKGYGYAFFPEITKGGFVVGGARGQGVVYEKGQQIGYAELTQMSVGFQAGLQDYSQLIVFENQAAMEKFKRNEIDFGANASAIVADKGAAMGAQFVDGVAVFVRPMKGAMAEVSLAGQQIAYLPN
jgi:lipid-binding SYLF domain-containing protein